MQNFGIHFSHPWLLLLLIPALALTVIPYFMLNKKYRKTRNRIISMSLHAVIMTLAVFLLAGIQLVYQIPNNKNEVLLLVDMSETQSTAEERRDEFVQAIISDGRNSNVQLGVVTFGFDQNYAVPLTNDLESIYESYINAAKPDVCATDIAAALKYTSGLFTNPETAKIVLITDGKETDEEAADVISGIVAQGIKVDTAYMGSDYGMGDTEVVSVKLPDYHIEVEDECDIEVVLYNDSAQKASLSVTLSDNGVTDPAEGIKSVELASGSSKILFHHTFTKSGLHEILISTDAGGGIEENDRYCVYLDVQPFDDILILEGVPDQSKELYDLLTQDDRYNVVVKTLGKDEDVPVTVDALRMYDQIIMNNVAEADLPDGMDEALYSYVQDYGGGMFTVGGKDKDGNAHAYKREDMVGTKYQEMLPVEAINYTPPLGVMILLDVSGSMETPSGTGDGSTRLDWAKSSVAGLFTDGSATFSERDYFGLMLLGGDVDPVLPLTPRTYEDKIISAINNFKLPMDRATTFSTAITRAAQELRTEKRIARRHMIIVSDGYAGDEGKYEQLIKDNYDRDGITLSVILLDSGSQTEMQEAVDLGHGELYILENSDITQLSQKLKEDLNADEIKEVKEENFNPTLYDALSPLVKGLKRLVITDPETGKETETKKLDVQLGGFFGVKVRSPEYLVLSGEYDVPIYAQWKFGKGKVGSFMSDLNGNWSSEFMQSDIGKEFLMRTLKNLLPLNNIKPSAISMSCAEDNYINKLSIFAHLEAGQKIAGQIINMSSVNEEALSLNEITQPSDGKALKDLPFYVTYALNEEDGYSRCNFVVRQKGVYKIIINKCDADGNVLATSEWYKQFSYSEEYDITMRTREEEIVQNLTKLAVRGNGAHIADLDDPWEVYSGIVTALDRSIDPRIGIIITIIVLFLLDIAVRKFKFKWIHEIVREHKEKKFRDK